MDNVAMPERGQTYFDGQTPPTTFGSESGLEGKVSKVADVVRNTTGSGGHTPRSGQFVLLRLVRNVGTITLAAKRAVKRVTTAGLRTRRVDGYCNIDFEHLAGVVDEWHVNGIPVNDLGYIVVGGPALCKTSLASSTAENTINVGDIITALTAAASTSTTAGRVYPAAITGTVTTAVSIAMNKLGRALSAKTSANTDADLLVDIELLKAS